MCMRGAHFPHDGARYALSRSRWGIIFKSSATARASSVCGGVGYIAIAVYFAKLRATM